MELPELLEVLAQDESTTSTGEELLTLQSIFGEDSLSLNPPKDESDKNIRLSLVVTLYSSSSSPEDNDDEVPFRLFVSLPPTYPESSPPQLQLASKYIGPVRFKKFSFFLKYNKKLMSIVCTFFFVHLRFPWNFLLLDYSPKSLP
jgi:hypothetical protein